MPPQNQEFQETYSQLRVPSGLPFFVRLNGRRFQAVAEQLKAQKPFDKRFAQCLVAAAKAIFKANLNPTLIYQASDELNILFAHQAPFNQRIEKLNSILASTASSAFTLAALKQYNKAIPVAFDSRIVITPKEQLHQYLAQRQLDLWRNHNNAYAYWLLRKKGHTPTQTAEKLKKLKTQQLHDLLYKHGINPTKTPAWQRRGILIHKEPYQKQTTNQKTKTTITVTRRRLKQNWNPPQFTTQQGKTLIQKIINQAKPSKPTKKEAPK
jgi:tRNA(His) 5'-end guanylyltransferase